MNELLPINYRNDIPAVSARDLHAALEIKTAFKDWFPRMTEYGFDEGKDFSSKMSESTGGRPSTDYNISIDMAKEICMLQRTEKGKQCRTYFIDLEKAWNTPEQIYAKALKFADKQIASLREVNTQLLIKSEQDKPKVIFADAVAASHTSILVGELAKLLRQNGIDIGGIRLFEWLRNNGYLIKRQGNDYNMPTQRAMDLELFEIKETTIVKPDGSIKTNKTTKVTGKGQQYFINKFLSNRTPITK
ncbi:MAG: phage antirepressor protein [Lachnospiraceae bacterium]|nr:phage antirepressor protein [Lachnospiraceae bacterium]